MTTKVKAALILNPEKRGSFSICRIVDLIEPIIIEIIKTIYKSNICSNGVALLVELVCKQSQPVAQIKVEKGVLFDE